MRDGKAREEIASLRADVRFLKDDSYKMRGQLNRLMDYLDVREESPAMKIVKRKKTVA